MNGKNQFPRFSRRNVLKFGAGVIGTSALTAGLGSQLGGSTRAIAQSAENDISPDEALQRLIDGNRRFATGNRQMLHQDLARRTAIATSQKPFASILSCADSRVPSEIIFDQGLGDLFVCRVAGNIATPEEIGSLEFGSLILGAKVIMVLGHERCGAVDATIKGAQVPGQIATLIDAIKPAVDRTNSASNNRLEEAIKANVLLQIEQLKTSPVLTQLIDEDKLKIVGGYYDLDMGEVIMVS